MWLIFVVNIKNYVCKVKVKPNVYFYWGWGGYTWCLRKTWMLLQWRQSRSLKWFLTSLLRRLGREKTRFSEIFINHVTECHWLGFRNSNVSGHHLKQAECVTQVMGHWSIPCLSGTFKLIWILAKEIPSQVPVCDTCISQDCLVIITWYKVISLVFIIYYLRVALLWKYSILCWNCSRCETSRNLYHRSISEGERLTLFRKLGLQKIPAGGSNCKKR